MAKLLQTFVSYILPLLFIQCLLFSLAQGQANGSFVDQSAYTTFELFKNTGLQPCPINTTLPKSPTGKVEARSPRGGGGHGGGSRGGGGGGGGGGYSGGDFIESTFVGDQASFCSKLTAIPVMIPNTPTQYAFTPWWPTFVAQFFSFLVTWVGLWWTTKTVEREGAYDMKLPILFWVQLPIDLARIIAWFVKTLHGMAVPSRFAWVNVIIWLIPFNYIWLVRLIGSRKAPASTVVYHEQPQVDQYGQPIYQNKEPHMVEANQQVVSATPAGAKNKFWWLSMVFAALTAIMWLLSLVVIIIHFKYSWFDKPRHPIYVEVAKTVSDPSSIAKGIPSACVDWLKGSSDTITSDLLDVGIVQTIQVIIVAFQFVSCTLFIGARWRKNVTVLSKLQVSALSSFAALGLPALATGFWILGTVTLGNQDEWLNYTNNFNTTGGCTFAAVNMGRKWGYWDVEYERGFRIAMSILGAA